MDKNKNLLKAGVKGNKGGTGRPPDWLKEKCQAIVEREKLIEFLADVASGKEVDVAIDMGGKAHPVPANCKNRIAAAIELLDRGFGKATQAVTHSVDDGLAEILQKARTRIESD
jgi:hypothetical protein